MVSFTLATFHLITNKIMNKNHYTNEDNKVLEDCIKECKTKIAAFQMAAEKLGRTPKSVQAHYYNLNHKKVLTLANSEKKKVSFFGWIKRFIYGN